MSTSLPLPDCLIEAYRVLFPRIVFSRVHFFQGLPWYVDTGQPGITLPSVSGDINVYIKPGMYNPCDDDYTKYDNTFLLLAHELVHVLQIQDSVGGGHIPGSWVTNYVSCYLASGFKDARGNCYEDEAYTYANGYPDEVDANGIAYGGTLRRFLLDAQQVAAPLMQLIHPCLCNGLIPWLPNTTNFLTFVVQGHEDELVKGKAECTLGDCLVNRFIDTPLVGAIWSGISFVGGVLAGVGTILGGIIGTIIDFIGNLFSSDSGISLLFSIDGGDTFGNKVTMERSSEPPAQTASDSELFVGWTGTDAQLNVFASPNSNSPPKVTFEKGDDDAGPALAFAFGKVFIAWQDENNHLHLMSASSPPGQNFIGKLDLGETLAGNSTPGLAFGLSRLYLAWIDSNNDIYIKSSPDGVNWGARIFLHERSPDGGTTALAFGHGRLYLAWTGTDDDNHVNVKSFFPRGDFLQVAHKVTLNERSSNDAGPALAIGNLSEGPRLFLAWTDDNQRLNILSSDDPNTNTWQPKRTLGHSSDNAGPALAFVPTGGNGLVCLAWIDTG